MVPVPVASLSFLSVVTCYVVVVAVVTDQALVAVAASHVSFAGTVPTDLITRRSHHNDPTRVAVASWIHPPAHKHAHTDEPLSFLSGSSSEPVAPHTYIHSQAGCWGSARNNRGCSRRSAGP